MPPPAYRHESKHRITYAEHLALRQRLTAICRHDEHAQQDGHYTVCSLYFDNADDKALREKIDGVNDREKFRLRYYNGDTRFIRLEKKSKHNQLCQKSSSPIGAEQVRRLLSGDTSVLRDAADPLCTELYAKMLTQRLEPKTIVDYRREAYVYPVEDVRITFDSDIRTGVSSLDFLNPDRPTIPAGNDIVLEIKYRAFLPGLLRDAIQTGERGASPFSKYAACRIYV